MTKKLKLEDFIKRAQKIHGDKYDYSQVKYINSGIKVLIHCNECGNDFWQTPSNHTNSNHARGCKLCSIKQTHDLQRKSQQKFIEEATKIHGNKYGYSEVKYVNNEEKIKIYCKKCHKFFLQSPSKHLAGQDCPCYKLIKMHSARVLSLSSFIEKAQKVHKNRYSYNQVEYFNTKTKVLIHCNKCNRNFEQTPANHLHGKGCPYCKQSKGEIQIQNWLDLHNIKYKTQKRFKNCRYKQLLSFDFYLPEYDVCIEYQGKQHYVSWYKDKDLTDLKTRKYRDKIKKEYCKKNKILLIEILYNDNIEKKLKECLDEFME